MKFILSLIRRRRFSLGPQVFQRKTWLQKQVEDAQYRESKKMIFGID